LNAIAVFLDNLVVAGRSARCANRDVEVTLSALSDVIILEQQACALFPL